ncbi:MAG: metal-dependent transcriptional regulator [Planctomycetota bacterium]
METWKEFDQNPVTHSAAHHLVTIEELLQRYGYARVSDVARELQITRGSTSVTLKGLKQRGLVTEDDRRFLRLSDEGQRIARAVRAKKQVLKTLFIDLLGVNDEQAEVDTCKIEHLISNATAVRASRFLSFLQSGSSEVKTFLRALHSFKGWRDNDPAHFPQPEVDALKLHGPAESLSAHPPTNPSNARKG